MADERAAKVSIGFQGGQVLGVRIKTDDMQALQRRLAAGSGGWHELPADDGPVLLDLSQVVYVRSESEEHRVGFALG